MYIKIGYDIELAVSAPTAVVFLLRVHPSRQRDLVTPDDVRTTPRLDVDHYVDSFGNRCGRVHVPGPAGVEQILFHTEAIIRDSGLPDQIDWAAPQHAVADLPPDTLQFLLPSRYCDVDSALLPFAWDQFGSTAPGAARVQAVCDFVHAHLRFDYQSARPTRTASDGFAERVGVCRDFTHLAITLCRCLNIPARYTTGYLGDIGVPAVPLPMDFSAWFEVYLGDRWHTFDARHNQPRIGRVVMARGRDACDVPITMAFGSNSLLRFKVTTHEVDRQGNPVDTTGVSAAAIG